MIKRLYRFYVLIITLSIGVTSCQSGLFQSHVTPAPTPQCVEPTLTLGITKFRIDSVKRNGDNFPEIPKNKKDVAFWVTGTTVNYVFGLSPTKDNLSLNTVLKAGDPITINWADCSKDEYVVKTTETANAGDTGIFDQSHGGITVFIGVTSSTPGLVIRGGRPIVQPAETQVATPENTNQIDLQILDFTQPDDQTVQFRITVTNKGAQVILLTNHDISLKTDTGPEVAPQAVEPVLPQDLKPGDTLSLTLTFPKPQAKSAVLRILDVTFEYYF
jgi:hypothetical protein